MNAPFFRQPDFATTGAMDTAVVPNAPTGPQWGLRRTIPAAIAALSILCAQIAPAVAQAKKNIPVVRDAEIEALVTDYAKPIFAAAGLARDNIRIVLVNDNSFNAFVDGRRIFMNTGTLMTAETPNEVIGVIAHETGHLINHDQEQLRRRIERARTMAIVAALLGAGATAAGAATHNSGLAGAGTGIAVGSSQAILRGLLSYQRVEEATADRTAITLLNKSHQSAKGMLTTFERFSQAMMLSGTQVNPYMISHPLPRDRIANLEALARKSPYFNRKDPAELQERHDLARAKIAAYTIGPAEVQRIFRKDPRSIAARYGYAISALLYGSPRDALSKIDALIRERPRNPYFYEMKGEILMKIRQASAAAKAYARAISLDRQRPALIRVELARALIATGDKGDLDKAVHELKTAIVREPETADGYGYLAQAYGRLGEIPLAELATADMHYYSGNLEQARIFAARAKQALKPGSPAWLRADDIINSKG